MTRKQFNSLIQGRVSKRIRVFAAAVIEGRSSRRKFGALSLSGKD
ncbi:hypothetical protein E2C01_099919 [Portunus trituberculatus]|uniref:Uncharacterized protein n=1 Tax=Portunus trituberculatus TaxID=210409 RepID=A0A5B7K1L7_PORTR|nr:hypothetical protein [Portunus trituberculatus]